MLQGRESLGKKFRWVNNRALTEVVFLSVRDALNSPAHPDSKRQARRKARDLERYGGRILKQSNVSCQPPVKISKRREFKEMRVRIQLEQVEFARKCTARLLGRKHAA